MLEMLLDVDKMYRERPDYNDGISSIYVTLAAQALSKLLNSASQEYLVHKTNEELEKIIVEYLNLADDRMKINEYVWIIKGFYEILQGI